MNKLIGKSWLEAERARWRQGGLLAPAVRKLRRLAPALALALWISAFSGKPSSKGLRDMPKDILDAG